MTDQAYVEARREVTAVLSEYVRGFARAIEHGDFDHIMWLREATEAYLAGRPVPPARGG